MSVESEKSSPAEAASGQNASLVHPTGLASLLRTLSGWAAILVMILSGLVLFAWVSRIGALAVLRSGNSAMRPSVALAFLLEGASLFLIVGQNGGSGRKLLVKRLGAAAFASSAAIVGVVYVWQYFSGPSLWFEELFVRGADSAADLTRSLQMPVGTAALFIASAAALMILDRVERTGRSPAQILSFFVALFSIAAFGVSVLTRVAGVNVSPYPSMTALAAFTFGLLSLGTLAARPNTAAMGVITTDATGGQVARRLLPAAMLTPIVLCIVCYIGYLEKWYDSGTGLALLTTLNSAILTTLVWRTAVTLNHNDAHRSVVEQESRRLERELRERLNELAQAERRMRSIVDNVVDGIITIDTYGTVETFNRAAESLFGYDACEVIGRNVRMLMPDPDRGLHDSYLSNYLRTREAKIIGLGRQVVGLRKDGSRFPMELAVGEYLIGDQQRFTGVVRDITERLRAQTEIELLNSRLRRAMTETHHRVKNNLQVIVAMLDMQAMENVDTIDTEEIRRVASHVRTLAQVHDLLTEQSKADASAEGVPARSLLQRLTNYSRDGAMGREIDLEAPDNVWLNNRQATSLALVTNELISNALKYGSGRVDVVFAVDPGGEARLLVEDRGNGFSEGFNVNTEANTGLELVNMLVRWDLQGSVTFGNRPDGGARVMVLIPPQAKSG